MKTYAKRIKDDKVVALLTYDYTPNFGENSSTVVISEEEYNALREEFRSANSQTDEISSFKALAIITGEEDITNETE